MATHFFKLGDGILNSANATTPYYGTIGKPFEQIVIAVHSTPGFGVECVAGLECSVCSAPYSSVLGSDHSLPRSYDSPARKGCFRSVQGLYLLRPVA
jgi:hypothetical protein